MKKALLVAALFLMVAFIAAWPWLKTQVAIDTCLDAGGRWNYEQELCEGAAKQ